MEIKPITIKPAVPAAAGSDPGAATAAAPSVPASGIKPITIKPMSASGSKPLSPDGGESATIRLKPIPPSGASPAAPTPLKPMPLRPTPLAAPPAGAPASPASLQAMKGKTSRISLDSALSSPPTAAASPAMGKLTSNLSAAAQAAKGQTAKVSLTIMDDEAMTRHQTLRMKAPTAKPVAPAPAASKPAAEDASEAPTIRKKTLVLKKDGESAPAAAPSEGADDTKPTLRLKPADGGSAAATKPKLTLKGKTAAEKDEEKKKADEAEEKAAEAAPGAGFDPSMVVQKPEKTNPVFPILAIASILVAMFTVILFMSERSSDGGADLSYTKLVFRYGPNSDRAGEPMGFPVFAGKQWQCPGLPRVTLFRR